MRYIRTDEAPAAVGAYSQAVEQNGFLFISGQIPIDKTTAEPLNVEIKTQVQTCLNNLYNIAKNAGYSKEEIIKITIYTTKMDKFPEINSAYAEFFGEHKPARAVVGVADLPKGVTVEIEAVCIKSS